MWCCFLFIVLVWFCSLGLPNWYSLFIKWFVKPVMTRVPHLDHFMSSFYHFGKVTLDRGVGTKRALTARRWTFPDLKASPTVPMVQRVKWELMYHSLWWEHSIWFCLVCCNNGNVTYSFYVYTMLFITFYGFFVMFFAIKTYQNIVKQM